MGKIVTAHYTDTQPSATTVQSGPLFATGSVTPSGMYAAVSITGTKLKSVKVPLLSEGILKQLVVKQSSGTAAAFVVELLMSGMPFPPGEQAVAAAAVGTIELFRIIPQQSTTSGNTLDITPDTDVGWPFRNSDGDHTNNQRYVYLVIKPTSASGTTKWDVFIMAESNHV